MTYYRYYGIVDASTAEGASAMTRQHAVFVYGTLRPGQRNYERLLAGRTVQESPAIAKGSRSLRPPIPVRRTSIRRPDRRRPHHHQTEPLSRSPRRSGPVGGLPAQQTSVQPLHPYDPVHRRHHQHAERRNLGGLPHGMDLPRRTRHRPHQNAADHRRRLARPGIRTLTAELIQTNSPGREVTSMCGLFGTIRPQQYPQQMRTIAAPALIDLGYLAEERGVASAG